MEHEKKVTQTLASLGEYCQYQKTQTDNEKIEQAYNSIWDDCISQQIEYADKYAKLIENLPRGKEINEHKLELFYQKAYEDVNEISRKAEKEMDKTRKELNGPIAQEAATEITHKKLKTNIDEAKDMLKNNFKTLLAPQNKPGTPEKVNELVSLEAQNKPASLGARYLIYSSNIIHSLLEKNRDALIEHVNTLSKEIAPRDNQKLSLNGWVDKSNTAEKVTDGNTIAPDEKSERLTTRLQRLKSEKNKD